MKGRTPFFSAWLDQWEAAGESLRQYRVLLAVGLVLLLPRQLWVSGAPDGLLFPPPGVPLLSPVPPGNWAVPLVNAAIVGLAVLLACGLWARLAASAIGVLFVLLSGWGYAFGKINHDILLAATPMILAFSGWADRRPEGNDGRSTRNAVPLALLALVVALALFTAAFEKYRSGWLDPATSASYYHVMANHLVSERTGILTEQVLAVNVPWFWELGDISTVLLEAAFIPALLTPRLFRWVCGVASLFHLGIWLTMDISFAPSIVAYGAFVPWGRFRVLQRVGEPVDARRVSHVLPAAAGALLVAGMYYRFAPMFQRVVSITEVALVLIAPVVVVVLGVGGIRRAAASRRHVKASRTDTGVVLFDGVCNLCNGFVDFLVRRDAAGRLRYASLQSPWAARNAAEALRLDADGAPSSMVLLADHRAHVESEAAIRIVAMLGGGYRAALALLVLPAFLRDEVYRIVARNRYRAFGRRETCRVPTEAERSRFLEE